MLGLLRSSDRRLALVCVAPFHTAILRVLAALAIPQAVETTQRTATKARAMEMESQARAGKKKTIPLMAKRETATKRMDLVAKTPFGNTIVLKVDDGCSVKKVKGIIK